MSDSKPSGKHKSGLELVGLIPAAGEARRLGAQPSSKEILEVRDSSGNQRPVIHFLLESMRDAGVKETLVIIAPGKEDIPATLARGEGLGLDLAYAMRDLPWGVPFTLDAGFSVLKGRTVVFGFPDIIFDPSDALGRLVKAIEGRNAADVVLGLFPVDNSSKWDAVVQDDGGGITDILPKPHRETSGLTWILAVWRPSFTRFIHDFVRRSVEHRAGGAEQRHDVSLGVVMRDALRAGLEFEGVLIEDGWCLDIGTPDDLRKVR